MFRVSHDLIWLWLFFYPFFRGIGENARKEEGILG